MAASTSCPSPTPAVLPHGYIPLKLWVYPYSFHSSAYTPSVAQILLTKRLLDRGLLLRCVLLLNIYNPLSPKSFSSFIAQNADAYRLEATNNVVYRQRQVVSGLYGYPGLSKTNHLIKKK